MGSSDSVSIEMRREYYTVNAQGQARLYQRDSISASGKTAREVNRLIENQVPQFRALT
jgi:protein involved in polysaccharide export with SLBB domain